MSSSSKKKKKSSRSKSSSSKLSGSAASMLALSPVVETHYEEYDESPSAATYYNNDSNYNDRLRLNEHDWEYQDQQQEEGGGRGQLNSYPQHYNSSEESGGGVDTSFDSDSGIIAGGEQSYTNSSSHHRRHSSGGSSSGSRGSNRSGSGGTGPQQQQQQRQRRHSSQQDSRRQRRLNAKSIAESVGAPPFSVNRNHQPSNDDQYSPSGNSPGGGGYDIAADSTVGGGGGSSNNILTPITPGAFEEADLLQRAIERRALLHNRIVAMEAAKAELERDHSSDNSSVGSGGGGGGGGSPYTNVHTQHYSTMDRGQQYNSPSMERGQGRGEGRRSQRLREVYNSTSMRHPPEAATGEESARRKEYNVYSRGEEARSLNNESPFDEDVALEGEVEDDDDDDDYDLSSDSLNNNANTASSSTTATDEKKNAAARKKPPRKQRMGEHHARMNELSERIKREALEFMSYESSYADRNQQQIQVENDEEQGEYRRKSPERRERLSHSSGGRIEGVEDNYDVNNNDFMNIDSDRFSPEKPFNVDELILDSIQGGFIEDEELDDIAEEEEDEDEDEEMNNSHASSSSGSLNNKSQAKIDSSAWEGGDKNNCVEPTSQQLSRYSNMVRLGIPDVAVLRSMERDGISNSHDILQQMKESYNIVGGVSSSKSDDPKSSGISNRALATSNNRQQQISLQRNRANSRDSRGSVASSSNNNDNDDEPTEERRLTLPLCEDPNYSKYFKMLKAKVPISWVRRVLEVDKKDSRVLDLDPNVPLGDQVPDGALDEFGNVDWDNEQIKKQHRRVSSSASSRDNSDVGGEGTATTTSHSDHNAVNIFASVKAELASMSASAKAGDITNGLRAVPFDEDASSSNTSNDGSYRNTSGGGNTLSQAAVAASNERMKRLRAIRADGGASSREIGRRRQTTDEIRRRPPPAPPSGLKPPSTNRQTYPQASSSTTTTSNEVQVSDSTKETDLPLKDDPRFSKYFQMIRSRVPRSWVERVIEVDDRDPAILDLDPNKSLASQIGEEHADEILDGEDENDTIDSTYSDSISKSTVGLSDSMSKQSTVKKSPAPSVGDDDKNEEIEQQPEETTDEDVVESEERPVAQIGDDEDNEEQSEASSITFREPQEEKPSIDLARISSFLDKMEAKINGQDTDGEAATSDDTNKETPTGPRFTTTEEVENKLAELLNNFGASQKASDKPQPEVSNNEQVEVIENSKADIAKLSALLATKIDKPSSSDADQQVPSTQELTSTDQSNLENLPTLLSQVLEKFEKPETDKLPEQTKETDSTKKESPNKALEALFAKRASLQQEEAQPKTLGEDSEYKKYFKMLKMGLPRAAVIQALERDGKDSSIIDLDPNRPLEEQQQEKSEEVAKPDKNAALKSLFAKRAASMKENDETESPNKKTSALEALFAKRSAAATQQEGTAPPLRTDPEFTKYMKMLKVGMPRETVRQALERDGKDPSVADMDPELSYASQVKKEEKDDSNSDPPLKEECAKFFKMLKMGIPAGAVRQALQKEGKDPNIVDMDPEKSYNSQVKGKGESDNAVDVPLKDDPEYTKFFKMLKMGIPPGAVQNALKKEGKDVNIVDMDPSKSYSSQAKDKDTTVEKDTGPPLKDDPEFAKFFKMLKMGIPMGAVQNALKKEGKDVNVINLDPEKPLSSQQPSKTNETKKPTKPKGPKVARKRLHWNKIDESKLSENSFWSQAKSDDLKLVGLDVDNEEFASLFTSEVGKKAAAPKKEETKKPLSKQKVQLIDGRRRMNGSILLSKFKVDYKVLARQVDSMEYIEAEGNELRGMMQLLPTKDESLALRSYLPPSDAPQSEIEESIAKLGECEQYMAVMLDVPDVKAKFQSMLFRAEFEGHADSIRDGTKMLLQACDAVKNSERFRKLLLYALKLGNALNTGGSNEEVSAITLDSLLKLAEAKAFDRQTSVLHYLVSIVQKNDEDVLKLSEDFVPVKEAERVAMDMLEKELKDLEKGVELLKNVVMRHLPPDLAVPADETPEDELLDATAMGKFSLSAMSKIQSLCYEFANAKSNFSDLLQFFGEDMAMTPEAFFCTINTFVSMFDRTHKELVRKEEAKARKKRIDEKRKLREEEMAAKKAKS